MPFKKKRQEHTGHWATNGFNVCNLNPDGGIGRGKKWTWLSDEFINLALTSTFSRDEPELYNPLAGFRGQQQRGAEAPGKSLSPQRYKKKKEKNLWHPIFNLIYQCKAKIDSVSLLGRELSGWDVSKPPHFDLARRINTSLYCFNLRAIDFSRADAVRGDIHHRASMEYDLKGRRSLWSAYSPVITWLHSSCFQALRRLLPCWLV